MRTRFRLSHGTVVAYLALFVALGGSAWAIDGPLAGTNTVGSSDIINGEVKTVDIGSQAVTAAQIKAPEAWHAVAPGSSTSDLCQTSTNTGVFCSFGGGLFANPWHNFGGGYATAGFYKDQLGIVHLKGLVTAPVRAVDTNPQFLSIFRLPAAYAPASTRVFPSVGRNNNGADIAPARIDVQPNGLVVFEQDCQAAAVGCSADGEYVTLEGISFRRDG